MTCAASGGPDRGSHMPLPPMVPAGTGRDRDFPDAAAGRATSDPGHIRTTGRLRFFRHWPGWRQVALMSRTDQTIYTSSEEGFRTMSAVSSESHEPASEPGRPHLSPSPDKPISAPTNGWSRSCTSATSRTLVPSTGRGGASSLTTSPLSLTERARSRSSASGPPLPRRPPRRLPRRPRRLRRSRPRRLPRFSGPRRRRGPSPLPRARLPRLRPLRAPRSAGCAARRLAPSPT